MLLATPNFGFSTMTLSSAEKHSETCPWRFPLEAPVQREYKPLPQSFNQIPESSDKVRFSLSIEELLDQGKLLLRWQCIIPQLTINMSDIEH